MSPNLDEEVVRGDIAVEKGGTLKEVSGLFIDIRGFTAMSERLGPDAVVSMLNEFFEIMVDIVFRHEGTLDKFIGDELMAVWGAPMSQDDHLERAIRAAVEMRTSLEEFNRFRKANKQIQILARTGIATGEVTAEYMG